MSMRSDALEVDTIASILLRQWLRKLASGWITGKPEVMI